MPGETERFKLYIYLKCYSSSYKYFPILGKCPISTLESVSFPPWKMSHFHLGKCLMSSLENSSPLENISFYLWTIHLHLGKCLISTLENVSSPPWKTTNLHLGKCLISILENASSPLQKKFSLLGNVRSRCWKCQWRNMLPQKLFFFYLGIHRNLGNCLQHSLQILSVCLIYWKAVATTSNIQPFTSSARSYIGVHSAISNCKNPIFFLL